MKISNLLLLIITLISFSAHASESPKPLGTDERIRHVMYNPNQVYDVTTTYGFQTAVEFSPQENIQVASIGDSIAWQVVPARNKLFIKPVVHDAVTNMTVVTDKRTYYFNLIALRSEALGAATYLVRFKYPQPSPIHAGLSTGPKNPTELNFDYKIKRHKKSSLIRAFDDGEFTYLYFEDLKELPAIFVVDSDGKESLANFRIKEPYVIIERVVSKLVLRNGKSKTRLYNQAYLSKGSSKS